MHQVQFLKDTSVFVSNRAGIYCLSYIDAQLKIAVQLIFVYETNDGMRTG